MAIYPYRKSINYINFILIAVQIAVLWIKRNRKPLKIKDFRWQGKKVSNPRPTVLETVALPAELFP